MKLVCPSCGYNGSPEGAGFTLVRELMARYVTDPIIGLDEVKVQDLADPEPTSYAACDECDYEGVFSEFLRFGGEGQLMETRVTMTVTEEDN